MPQWLPRLVTRHARAVIVFSVVLVVLAGVVGAGAVGRLKGGGFDDPKAPSSRAKDALASTFNVQESNLLVLVTAAGGRTVNDSAVAAQARSTVRQLRAEPGVTVLGDYWDASGQAASGLRSSNAHSGLILLNVAGDDDAAMARTKTLSAKYTRAEPAASFQTGGYQQVNLDITNQVTKDLAKAESIAIPLTLILLILAFGAVVAGLLPLMVAGIAIAGTFAVLFALTLFTDVSIFALNLTTAMAIGLGVDYSLLIVSRFREELAARGGVREKVEEAVTATVRTAGRTVLFSALTIAVALSALTIFPLYFLRSFAYAGVAVVAVAAAAALFTVPAVLMVLGPRVNLGRIGRKRPQNAESPFWRRLANVVMRRPVLTGFPVVVLLLALGLPFLHVSFGLPDDRGLPASVSQGRRVGDVLRAEFTSNDSDALVVVLPAVPGGVSSGGTSTGAIANYATTISKLDGVARVDSSAGSYLSGRRVVPASAASAAEFNAQNDEASWLRVVPSVDYGSDAAQSLVHQIRALPAPGSQLVGGPSAELVDTKASIGHGLPLGAGLIALSTLVLLFAFTGSVVIPVKALLINAVSIVGVLGAMAWIFQQGHGASLLDVTPTPLSLTMPLLMFCVAFGLSMDYEVFLLGRIKEAHDAGADTRTAVGFGLARTGRIVTTAAALLAITFFAFVSSKVSFIQMFGLGTGLAIVLDATLVRGVLVPALMRLMGGANWWAPGPLRRLHQRFGLTESDGPAPAPLPDDEVVAVGASGLARHRLER